MKITKCEIKIGDLCKSFDISLYSGSDEDVMCYDGKLNCRPAYQRNYVYDGKAKGSDKTKAEQVLDTIFKGYRSRTIFPLSIMYWQKMEDGTYQIIDGQQRTLTVLLYHEGGKTLYDGKMFVGLQPAEKEWFENYPFTVYICEKDENQTEAEFEAEVLEWFTVINIAGVPLTDQELRNATYFGPWVSAIKGKFSNDKSEIFKEQYKTESYIKIDKSKMNRQEFLERVLLRRAQNFGMSIEEYMSIHRNDPTDTDLFNYFVTVLNWVKEHFTEYNKDVLYGQEWGRLYNTYHETFNLSKEEVNAKINELVEDDEVEKNDGIVEYILSGYQEKFLHLRAFDEKTRKRVFLLQGKKCPLCEDEKRKNPDLDIQVEYDTYKKMEADHLIPWRDGGRTDDERNCCMLCPTHNKHKSADQIRWLNEYMKTLWENKE